MQNSDHSIMNSMTKMIAFHLVILIYICKQVAAPPSCSRLRVIEEEPEDGCGCEGQYDLIPTNFTSPVYHNAEKDK